MKTLQLLGAACSMLLLAGCSTIVFHNGPVKPVTQTPITETHHGGGIFELFEFSPPKDLSQICNGNRWDSIATEMTFVDGLIKQLVPYGIYSPRTTYTVCADKATTIASATPAIRPDTTPDNTLTTKSKTVPMTKPGTINNAAHRTHDDKSIGCRPEHRHLFFGC